jgi:serine/threonine protein kinase/Flp pilus assembly protein TadD
VIQRLSKYRIIEKLGAGGMGEVYRAEDPALLRTVAIKVLSKQHRESDISKTRFLREAQAASAINHPNIVTIYEIGETDEQAYIVMEYVQGRSIRDLIAGGLIASEEIFNIAMQICDALAEAHSRKIIHRDIKPENILLTERGQVKVLDFGLAKTLSITGREIDNATAIERLTESGVVVGTLSYMSPEQLRGDALDERTDIFSFGIALYEMISGSLPFAGANPLEVAASILKDQAMRLEKMPADMPAGICEVVARLLEKDRGKRYGTFAEVKSALEAAKLKAPEPEPSDYEKTVELESKSRIERAIEAARITASMTLSGSRFSKDVSPPTILILPLESVASSDESSFIGVGLAHAIMTDLAKISGLSVLSKSASAGRAIEAGQGARELARELGATIMLEGEVMRAGQIIGVMARLTDVETARVIWGSQYRGDAADLFSIQDAVCESVALALKINVTGEVRDQIAKPPTTNIDAFEFYSKGRAFLERRDVKTNVDFAIQMFEEALRLDTEFALAYAGLGEASWRKYQDTRENSWVDRAIAASDHALTLDPYQAQVRISLGIIYHGTGKIGKAIEEFERAIELQPMSDDAYKWLGRCYVSKGEKERAVSYYEKAIRIRPGYWDNYSQLGYCYYTFGHYRDASEQFRRVIAIQPDNYLGYNNLGGMYYLLGLYNESVAMYLKAIEIYPHHRAYSNLGSSYFYLGRYDEAITSYKAALDLDPRNDIYHRNLGDAYLRMSRQDDAGKQYQLASDLLKELLIINPANAELLGRLAICQAKLWRKQEALVSIEQAVALEPNNTTLMYQKAVVYALTEYADKAIKYLGQALDHGYSRSEAERDPDLNGLRDQAEYISLFSVRD